MGKLVILVGMSNAGKSTWAKEWADDTPPDWVEYRVIVNADNVRLALTGERFNRSAEPVVHVITEMMVRTLFMNENTIVCIDQTNTTISEIRKWLMMDPLADVVFIDCPVDTCKARALAKGHLDLLPVIDRMYDNLLKLCNYTIDKRILSGEASPECRIDFVNEDDVMMSVEDIRKEVKSAQSNK